jgi:serine/threonine-protein kinase
VTSPPGSAAASPNTLPFGHIFAEKYRIERVLGDGVSGTVYTAERLPGAPALESAETAGSTDGREGRVALKVIHRSLVRDRQISRRFHREAAILRKLRCPYIVPLLDFGELDDGVLYIALERVQGRALDEIIRGGPLDPVRAVTLAQQVCVALEAAHATDVVHRDLKPGNVLIERTPDGEERARVCDFGMAKVLRGDPSDSLNMLTEQNMVFGTPEYMAPEQARGDEVDARCDVYAMGVMLYEMLTGAPPFRYETPIGVMTAHLVEEPMAPSSRVPGTITPALEAVVLHALAKKPGERYASAAALADALESAMRRPSDVASARPQPGPRTSATDLGTRDTDHALHVSASLRRREGATRPAARGSSDSPQRAGLDKNRRFWIAAAFIAALLGIAVGVAASLAGPR